MNCKVRLVSETKVNKRKIRKKTKTNKSNQKSISISCYTCKKQNRFTGANSEDLKELEKESQNLIQLESKKLDRMNTNKNRKTTPVATKEQISLSVKKPQASKETTKMKKRKKRKNTLRTLLQNESEKDQTSHSLSDFLQHL